MNFMVIFAACFIAFVAADDEIPANKEAFKVVLDEYLEENSITCENNNKKSDEIISEYDDPNSREVKMEKEKNMMIHKYLCEGKNQGNELAALYSEFLEMTKKYE